MGTDHRGEFRPTFWGVSSLSSCSIRTALRGATVAMAGLSVLACSGSRESPVGPDLNSCVVPVEDRGPSRRWTHADGVPISVRNDPTIVHMRDLMQSLGRKIDGISVTDSAYGELVVDAYLRTVAEIAESDGRSTTLATELAAVQLAIGLQAVLQTERDPIRRESEGFRRIVNLESSLRTRSPLTQAMVYAAGSGASSTGSLSVSVPPDSAFVIDAFYEIGVAAGDTVGTIANALSTSSSVRDSLVQLTADTARIRQLIEGELAIDSARSAVEWMALTAWVQSEGTLFPSFSCSGSQPTSDPGYLVHSRRVEACPWCATVIGWVVRTAKVAFGGAAGGVVQDIMFGDGQDMPQAAGQGAASAVVAWGIGLGFLAIGNVYGRVMAEIIQTWIVN
jgi:hypothetical protein